MHGLTLPPQPESGPLVPFGDIISRMLDKPSYWHYHQHPVLTTGWHYHQHPVLTTGCTHTCILAAFGSAQLLCRLGLGCQARSACSLLSSVGAKCDAAAVCACAPTYQAAT